MLVAGAEVFRGGHIIKDIEVDLRFGVDFAENPSAQISIGNIRIL
jgi:hypothetical protein